MQHRQLGGSGLRVSRYTLGTMTWGDATDAYDAQDQLTTFLQMGGTTIDTAPIYGRGNAEQMIGTLLDSMGLRHHVVLAGKAGIRFDADGPPADVIDASRRTLLRQLDQSLSDLGTDHLDLWQIHRWDPTVDPSEVLSAIDYALNSGRTRYVGVSNYSAWQLTASHLGLLHATQHRLLSNQVEYSLMSRDVESQLGEVLDLYGLSMMAWSPLSGGVLTGKYRGGTLPGDSRGADQRWADGMGRRLTSPSGVVEAVVRAADGLGATPAQVSLAWVADRPQVATTILGARTASQLAVNLEADQMSLPPEIASALDDVSQPSPSVS